MDGSLGLVGMSYECKWIKLGFEAKKFGA